MQERHEEEGLLLALSLHEHVVGGHDIWSWYNYPSINSCRTTYPSLDYSKFEDARYKSSWFPQAPCGGIGINLTWFFNRYRMWHSQESHFKMFSHSFCVAILKRNQRRRSFLLRNLQTSKILRSMMKNASNLIGQVQKLLKKESGFGPKFHSKDDPLWLWITRGTPPMVRVVPHGQGDAQWGKVPIQNIFSGDEDNGSLYHDKNEYKLIQCETRL